MQPKAFIPLLQEMPIQRLAKNLLFPEFAGLASHGPETWLQFVQEKIASLWDTCFRMPVFPNTFQLRPSSRETRIKYARHLLCGKDKPLSEAVFARLLAVAALEETLLRPLLITREHPKAEGPCLKFVGLYKVRNLLLTAECIVLSNVNRETSRLVTSYGTWDGQKKKMAFSTLCSNIGKAVSILWIQPQLQEACDSHKGRSRLSSVPCGSLNCAVLSADGQLKVPRKNTIVKQDSYGAADCAAIVRLLSLRRYQGEPFSDDQLVDIYQKAIAVYGKSILQQYPIPDHLCRKKLSALLLTYPDGFLAVPLSGRGKRLSMKALLQADDEHMQMIFDAVPARLRDTTFLESLLTKRPEYAVCLKQHEWSKKIQHFVLRRMAEGMEGKEKYEEKILARIPEKRRQSVFAVAPS